MFAAERNISRQRRRAPTIPDKHSLRYEVKGKVVTVCREAMALVVNKSVFLHPLATSQFIDSFRFEIVSVFLSIHSGAPEEQGRRESMDLVADNNFGKNENASPY